MAINLVFFFYFSKVNKVIHSLSLLTFILGPNGYKISCSTQLSMKFIMLINVEMPTIVGISTYISRINTTSESLKARKVLILRLYSFYERLKFHAQLSSARTFFYNLGARF